jgi:branched-chain amino acid transport system permease protein
VDRRNAVILVVVAGLAAWGPWIEQGKYAALMADLGVYALITIGLGLLMGYAGQVSLGHAGFFAVGAYFSAILTTRAAWSPWPAMAAGAVATTALAVLVGIPTLRLKGHYLAMATLGFGEIVYVVLKADPGGLTGGPDGIGEIPRLIAATEIAKFLSPDRLSLGFNRLNAHLVWLVVLAAAVLALNLIRSRVGRALRSIHDSETAANAVGVNVARVKLQVFVLSAVLASLAGSLHAHFGRHVGPGSFDLMWSIKFVMAVVLGGMATVWGPIAGAVIIGTLRTVLELPFFKKTVGLKGDHDAFIVGLVILLIMLFAPRGLVPGMAALFVRLRRHVDRLVGRP